ncbi:MAG: hypothetical protein JXA87_10895 [Thermoleophilia bacterium]|nr:hypothetical protein [Thermoleophilia bacterium]
MRVLVGGMVIISVAALVALRRLAGRGREHPAPSPQPEPGPPRPNDPDYYDYLYKWFGPIGPDTTDI